MAAGITVVAAVATTANNPLPATKPGEVLIDVAFAGCPMKTRGTVIGLSLEARAEGKFPGPGERGEVGACRVEVHEVLRVREALTNAAKHSRASEAMWLTMLPKSVRMAWALLLNIAPLRASAISPKPARSASGPVWP